MPHDAGATRRWRRASQSCPTRSRSRSRSRRRPRNKEGMTLPHQGGNWAATLLPFVVVAIVIALRVRSMSKERPLKLETLWIVPAVYALIAGSILFSLPPPPTGWGLVVVGLAIGLVVG